MNEEEEEQQVGNEVQELAAEVEVILAEEENPIPSLRVDLVEDRQDKQQFIIDQDGTYVGRYDFTAVSDTTVCTKESNCSGWDIRGKYIIKTYTDGKSKFEIEATVKSWNPWSEGGIYGIAFNFPFKVGHTGEEDIVTPLEEDAQTE